MFSTADSTGNIEATLQAAFETLIRLHYLRHGFERCNSFSTQFLNILAFKALKTLQIARTTSDRISNADFDDARSTLILASKGLYDQGKNWYLCHAILNIIRDAMAPDELALVERFVGMTLKDGDEAAAQSRSEFMSTAEYPLDIAKLDDSEVDARRLGNVLKQKNASRQQAKN